MLKLSLCWLKLNLYQFKCCSIVTFFSLQRLSLLSSLLAINYQHFFLHTHTCTHSLFVSLFKMIFIFLKSFFFVFLYFFFWYFGELFTLKNKYLFISHPFNCAEIFRNKIFCFFFLYFCGGFFFLSFSLFLLLLCYSCWLGIDKVFFLFFSSPHKKKDWREKIKLFRVNNFQRKICSSRWFNADVVVIRALYYFFLEAWE